MYRNPDRVSRCLTVAGSAAACLLTCPAIPPLHRRRHARACTRPHQLGRTPRTLSAPCLGGAAAVYSRRDPTATPPYVVVQKRLETFLTADTATDPDGEGVPR